MRAPRAVWIGTIGVGVGVSIWSLIQLIMTPVLLPPHSPSVHAVRSPVATAASGRMSAPWKDPSIDPQVLEKAFAPPPPLPPQARPKPSALVPPAREWERIQRQDDAVAY